MTTTPEGRYGTVVVAVPPSWTPEGLEAVCARIPEGAGILRATLDHGRHLFTVTAAAHEVVGPALTAAGADVVTVHPFTDGR